MILMLNIILYNNHEHFLLPIPTLNIILYDNIYTYKMCASHSNSDHAFLVCIYAKIECYRSFDWSLFNLSEIHGFTFNRDIL